MPSSVSRISSFDGRGGAPDPLAVLRALTDRDRWLLDTLDQHQVLTTDQLTDLAFPSAVGAQRRLLRLTQLRVLDRFRGWLPVGSQPWHYTTGPVGEVLLAASRGADPPRPQDHRARVARLAASPRLGHLLGVNGLFVALATHARRHPETSLDAWWSERQCAKRYAPLARPDGYGMWTVPGRSVAFFVEYDTGTEPLRRVLAKLPGYADLAAAGGPDIPVLFWTPSARREANLRDALSRAGTSVLVATGSADLAAAQGLGPAGPVWLTRPGGGRQTLADLDRTGRALAARPASTGSGFSDGSDANADPGAEGGGW